MEGEIWNLVKMWFLVITSLTYCYFFSSRIPKGKLRLISLLPIISIFILAPLLLSSAFMQFYLGAFIGWFANFKLLLFAFGKDDILSVNPSMSLLHFILLITLPIKIKQNSSQKANYSHNLDPMFIINTLIWSVMVQIYVNLKQHTLLTNPVIVHLVYSARMFFGSQIHFAMFAAIAKSLLGQELEPQFDHPHLSTSLQNFWGRRWNLMVSSLLKSTIHEPTKSFFTPILGRKWALHPAILATYIVSGLMHELVHFYIGRRWPTWEVFWFFIIHGVCLVVEMEVKKIASRRGWKLPWILSVVLTVGFVMSTGIWLCYAELIHWGTDVREVEEYSAFVEQVKDRIQTQWMFTSR